MHLYDRAMAITALSSELHSLGRYRCPRDWSLTPARTRTWTDLDLWLLLSGEGTVQTPDGRYDLRPGACLLMRGGEDYTFAQSARRPFVHYWAHFDFHHAAGLVPWRQLTLPPRFRQLVSWDLAARLWDRALSAWDARPANPELANRWFDAVLLEVAQHDRAAHPLPPPAAQTQARIAWLCRQIEDSPGAPYYLDKLAADLGLSRTHFCRLFCQHTGLAPQRFVIRSRMRAACTLLRESDYSVGQIAAELGYQDVFYFSRHFKAYHRLSPSAYRHR